MVRIVLEDLQIRFCLNIYFRSHLSTTIYYHLCMAVNCLHLFLLVQASMDLPPDKAKLLRNYDDEKKWDMICDQVSRLHNFRFMCVAIAKNCLNRFSPPCSSPARGRTHVCVFIISHFLFMANAKFLQIKCGQPHYGTCCLFPSLPLPLSPL